MSINQTKMEAEVNSQIHWQRNRRHTVVLPCLLAIRHLIAYISLLTTLPTLTQRDCLVSDICFNYTKLFSLMNNNKIFFKNRIITIYLLVQLKPIFKIEMLEASLIIIIWNTAGKKETKLLENGVVKWLLGEAAILGIVHVNT